LSHLVKKSFSRTWCNVSSCFLFLAGTPFIIDDYDTYDDEPNSTVDCDEHDPVSKSVEPTKVDLQMEESLALIDTLGWAVLDKQVVGVKGFDRAGFFGDGNSQTREKLTVLLQIPFLNRQPGHSVRKS
jgi:hypothetical protein